MTNVQFHGNLRDYLVVNAERAKRAVDDILAGSTAEIDGEVTFGASLSFMVATLRDKGFKMPGAASDQEKMFAALGYRIVDGKTGRWTKGGWKHCSPATVVTV